MPTAEAREVATEAISVTNASTVGHRGFHDAASALIMLKPGEDIADVTVPTPVAENMRQWSTDGTSDLVVSGSEPAAQAASKGAEKELSRQEIDDLEKKNLQDALKKSGSGSTEPGATPAASRLSRGDMDGMTKAELAEHASSIGVDVPSSATKQDVIDAIVKGQRR